MKQPPAGWKFLKGCIFVFALPRMVHQRFGQRIGGPSDRRHGVDARRDVATGRVAIWRVEMFDERSLLFFQTSPDTSRDLWVWTISGEEEPTPFRQSEADERCGAFSPDGHWIAYSSNESGRYEVYVSPFPGPGRRWQVSPDGGLFPQWRADGREVVYTRQDGQLMAAQVSTGSESLHAGGVQPLFRIHPPRPDGTSFALAPDGERLLVWTTKQRQSETVLNLVVNWPESL